MENDPEEFSEKDELIDIDDYNLMLDNLRKDGIVFFNERFAQEGLMVADTKFKNVRKWPKKTLESIIKMADIKGYVKEAMLPINEETQKPMLNNKIYDSLVERVSRNIFYNICNRLTDQGVFEMYFNEEKNDFTWGLSKKYREETQREDGEVNDEPEF